MTIYHYIGVALVLSTIFILGIYSGKKAKEERNFVGSKKNGSSYIVVGTIIGALVGGSSTVGTVELAYSYGFSAWWFTLGGGIGCFILACFFSEPLQNSNAMTLPEIISNKFGNKAALITTILTSIGNFLTVTSQILAGIALITSITNTSPVLSGGIIVILMIIYVVFGGSYSVGYVGLAKTILIYTGLSICGVIALVKITNRNGIYSELVRREYFNLFSRGFSNDLNAGISLIVGVLTTQAYLQAVITAKSYRVARKGLLVCSVLLPLAGLAGIIIGIYMQNAYPEINPSYALCIFILDNTYPVIGGAIIASLLIAVVGTGAGITLGISTMFTRDIYSRYVNKNCTEKSIVKVSQITITVVLLGAMLFILRNINSPILDIGYLSMALRGAVAFAPLCFALFINRSISSNVGIIAISIGPITMILLKFLFDVESALLIGIIASFVVLIVGYLKSDI